MRRLLLLFLLAPLACFAQTTIDALTSGNTLTGAVEFPMWQVNASAPCSTLGQCTYKTTLSAIAAFTQNSLVALPFTLTVPGGGTGAISLSGPIKGNGSSAFTIAAASDIYNLWGGSCSGSTFLRGDGICSAPSGSGTVTTSGSPVTGGLASFSAGTVITSGDLSGDCSTSGSLVITCTKSNGTAFGTFAAQNYATPPAIGGTTPAGGAFTTLAASSTVSGAGFITYFASPPAFGSVTPNSGAFTTLAASAGITSGSPTGGNEGAGTINAVTIYQNGVPLPATFAGSSDVQTFSASGTWTKPSGSPKFTDIECWGGGAGGGSGAQVTLGTAVSGGAGGGGGQYGHAVVSTASMGASETVTLGSGGTAGSATSGNAGGNAGGNGGNTSFGLWVTAWGGFNGTAAAASANSTGGAGGTMGSGSGVGASGGAGGTGNLGGGAGGGDTAGSAGSAAGNSVQGSPGGGSGGGISASTAQIGGAGAIAVGTPAAPSGGALGTAGTAATSLTGAYFTCNGPSGGGANASGNGGAGGAGCRGSGGAGGGAGAGHPSGAGGVGGTGYCKATTTY